MRLSQSLCLTAMIRSAFAIFCVSCGLGGALHKVFGPGGGDEVHDAQKMNCELSDPGSSLSRQQNQLTPISPNNWETEKNLQKGSWGKHPNPNGGKCVLEKHTSQKDSGEEIGRPFGPPLPRSAD